MPWVDTITDRLVFWPEKCNIGLLRRQVQKRLFRLRLILRIVITATLPGRPFVAEMDFARRVFGYWENVGLPGSIRGRFESREFRVRSYVHWSVDRQFVKNLLGRWGHV